MTYTPCLHCGGPKGEIHRGMKLCPTCRKAAEEKRIRHRPCSACGGPKEPGRRRVFCDTCAALRVAIREASYLCSECREKTVRVPRAKTCQECFDAKGTNRQLPSLPAAPLADLLNRLIIRERVGNPWAVNFPAGGREAISRTAVCERAGINPRQLLAWQKGEYPTVHFDIVDRVLCNLGLLWFDVYTHDDPVAYRAAKEAFEGPA